MILDVITAYALALRARAGASQDMLWQSAEPMLELMAGPART